MRAILDSGVLSESPCPHPATRWWAQPVSCVMPDALARKDDCARIASERLAMIDGLLIEGIRIGSASKRRAINKVLRDFPEFTRGDCWQRIRYLRRNLGAGSLRVCQCDRVTSVSKTGPNRRPVARQWTEADDDK